MVAATSLIRCFEEAGNTAVQEVDDYGENECD